MSDGQGLQKLIPSLSVKINELSISELYCTILKGKTSALKEQGLLDMPANEKISEVEMCNLLNYLIDEFKNEKQVIKINEIKLLECPN